MIKTPVAPATREDMGKLKDGGMVYENADLTDLTDVDKRQKYPRHELLGSRAFDIDDTQFSWRNFLDVREVAWLAEHVLLNRMTFPATAYIAMTGESMRQVMNGSLESYALRDFSITSALLLRPDEKVELLTRLRPVNVAGETSQTYEVQITSYEGGNWVERCFCRVSPYGAPGSEATIVSYPKDASQRNIERAYWYDVVANNGLEYGPSFQALDEISTSLTEYKAVATISPSENATASVLHPVTMDQCLQILMVAACKGQGRQLGGLCAVTAIERLVVSSGKWEKLKVGGTITKNVTGGIIGDASVVSEKDHPMLSMKSCKISVVPNNRLKPEEKLFSFVKWDTDALHCNLNRALAPFHPQLDPSILLERLTLLHLLNMGGSFGAPGQAHLQKVYDTVLSKRRGEFGIINDTSTFKELDPTARKTVLQLLKTQISGTKLESLGSLVEHLLTSGEPFSKASAERKRLLGQCHPLVRNNGVLASILKLLAHKNPKLRVLELGNGTEETTHLVLEALKSNYGERLYSTYTYAAASLDATSKAMVTLKETHDVNVVFFDVEKQIQGQNLRVGSYDLIITTDFISPARNVKACIDQLRQLISPYGHLLLLDTLPEPEWSSLIKDYLSDWSLTTTSASKDEKFISEVHTALLQNDFVFGPGSDDSLAGLRVVAELKKSLKHPKKITLVVPDRQHPLINAVQIAFHRGGIKCDRRTFESDIPQDQDMISIVDFGEPYLYNFTDARFRDFASRLSGFKGSLIWVTPTAQISSTNPNSSMILGMARTLRAELRKDITVVEIDVEATTYLTSSKSLLKIYQGLSHRPKARDVDPDYEYAIVDGDVKIPRIHWTTGKDEFSKSTDYSTTNGSRSRSVQFTNTNSSMPIRFRSDACYLLVGGLGGLGRLISTWMVENGARDILFLSRSAKEGPETTPFFDELRNQGCAVSTFAGSVNDLSDVVAAVAQATKPLAGIMQMSAVMRDNWMSQMTFTEWDQCVRPKVQGTWNLHQATSSANLDFFLLFSSVCGMTGQWGQANYNAANSFLDAFVNYRHGQDLPASVVDIGFMGSVGMAMENSALVEKLKTGGYYFLSEQDLIDALTIAIVHSRPGPDRFMNKSQLGLGFRSTKPITSPSTRVVWKKDARMAISHQFGSLGTITDDEAKEALKIAYQG